MPDFTERIAGSRVRRPDVFLAVIALLFASGVGAALVSPLPTLPLVAVGCVGCICVICLAVFVHPPVESTS